jgi:eukaryotic-like serine/threonine-protein kinase
MTRHCPTCGEELPEGTPAGQCPNCLIGLGLDAAGQVSPESVMDASRKSQAEPGGVTRSMPLRLGGYELLERIGQGGMGVVYKARQISLNRVVALKTLPFGSDVTRQHVHRFRVEAVAAGALQHPNIVAVHEVGMEEGEHYLVMDYVQGTTLAQLTRGGPLPATRAARYVRQIAEAVQFAHDRGVLHRDLKPSNVLVDAQDQPRLTDFGLAKAMGSNFGFQTSSLTVSGQALGSPGYIPPEQASGKRGLIGRHSDVYGLGALLYHLVTGRAPFHADTLEGTLQQVFHQEPVSPRLLNPSVPRDLDTICLKCLEKEPERRYSSAQALADELDRFLKREPILARPVGLGGKSWRWCRRKPVVASLAAALLLLLFALAIGGPLAAAHQRALAEQYRKLSYAAELSAAWQAWDSGNVDRCIELLNHHRPTPGQSDLREFTWRLLRDLCQPALDTPEAMNPAPVFLSAVSRDGRRFAVSGPRGSAAMWNAASRQLEWKIETGEAFAGGVAFSPDGRLLVTTGRLGDRGEPGTFCIREVRTGAKLIECDFGNAQGHAGEYSPDGRWFALDVTNAIVLLDVEHGWKERRRLQGHTGVIWQISWAPIADPHANLANEPRGMRLVSASADKTARVWDAATGRELGRLEGHGDVVRNALFSPDGRAIATGSLDGTVRLWDAETFTELTPRYQPSGAVMGLAFSRNGRWLAVGSHFDGLVTLIDFQMQKQRTLRAQFRSVKAVSFVLGDTVLVTAGLDQTIRFWDLIKQPPEDALEQPAKTLVARRFCSSDGKLGKLIVTVSTNGTRLLFWDVATGAYQSELVLPTPDLRDVSSAWKPAEADNDSRVEASGFAFMPDETLVVARVYGTGGQPTNLQHRIELHDLQRRVVLDSFPGRLPIACSPDGRRIAIQGIEDGSVQVRVLGISDRMSSDRSASVSAWIEPRHDPPLKRHDVQALAFSPDGTILAASGFTDLGEGYLILLESSSGQELAELRSSSSIQPPTFALAFTPDGSRLVSGGLGTKVQFWDVPSGRLVDEWVGHSSIIESLAISPDGKTLATGSARGLIKLWSVEQRAELLTLPAHERHVASLRFSPDSQILASAGRDGRVRLWRAPQ